LTGSCHQPEREKLCRNRLADLLNIYARGYMPSAPRWPMACHGEWAPYDGKEAAFDYFLKTKPIAKIGWSIFIYKIDEPTAAILEAERNR